MRDRLLLDRGVHDHALQFCGLDGLDLHSRLDGELQQLLHAFFANGGTKAPDLRGIARQTRLVVLHTAEELPHHVLAPARHQLLVTEVEGVLQVQQAGHQSNGQARPATVAEATTELDLVLAQHPESVTSPR